MLALERWSRSHARYHHTSARYRHLPTHRLRRGRAAAAFVACAVPVLFGFVLPGGILIVMAAEVSLAGAADRFFALARNSFTLGCITAALAVALSLMMAFGARLSPRPLTLFANRVASMGYAVPGTVMAVGILGPAAFVDRTLDAWMRATFDVSTGLLLTGSVAVLVFAYLVRFLAVSIGTVESGLVKINPNMEHAARVLGLGAVGTLIRVHVPIMRASLITAALLIFVDVVKELPATLLLRPFNFDTLAVQAYNFAADERLAEASIPSLMIVAVGIVPVVLLSRTISSSRPGGARANQPPPRSLA
jgi:iron(III) transport system permease protein